MEYGVYITLGRYVYLGRANKNVHRRAAQANLIPLRLKDFMRRSNQTGALSRIKLGGTWHDTVKY